MKAKIQRLASQPNPTPGRYSYTVTLEVTCGFRESRLLELSELRCKPIKSMGFDAGLVRETKPDPAHDLGRKRQAIPVAGLRHAIDCDLDADCTCRPDVVIEDGKE